MLDCLLFQGQKAKQARESLGLTLMDVEEQTGIKTGALSEIERGVNKNPRPATVSKLCKIYNKDAFYFYYSGENISDLFPKEIPNEVREFIFDIENIPYLELAIKIKKLGLKVNSVHNLLTAYANTINDHLS